MTRKVVAAGRVPNTNETLRAEDQRRTDWAFDFGIERGVLSADENAANYAGGYMFMGVEAGGRVMFKNINNRTYIYA